MKVATISDPNVPTATRKGVSWDRRAKQFQRREGYKLNDDGKRVRASQYLGRDPEDATLKHMELGRDWRTLKREWKERRVKLRTLLPEHLEQADLSKPFWLKPEWEKTANLDVDVGAAAVYESHRSSHAACHFLPTPD